MRAGIEGLLAGSDAEMAGQLRQLVDDAGLRQRISEHNRTVASPMTWANAMARRPGVGARPGRRAGTLR